MKNKAIFLLFSITTTFFLTFQKGQGQDLEHFFDEISQRAKNNEWLKINGSISATSFFNSIKGYQPRTDPFSFRLNANLNLDFLGIKAPFSLSVADDNKVYQLPSYSFYGISPSYKWVKIHLGDRSMEFSPYTLSGHNFFGAGIELTPGKFRISAMKGRLKKATPGDLMVLQNIEPSLAREGWGLKAGFESGKNSLAVMVFHAEDKNESADGGILPENLLPQENTAIGLQAKRDFGGRLLLEVDYGYSSFSRNTMSPLVENPSPSKKLMGLFTPRNSSGYYHALKSSIGSKFAFGQIGLTHEWIAPGYKTLGTLFFNDDREQWSAHAQTSLFGKRLHLSTSLGLQRNNLNQLKQHSQKRIVGSFQMNWQPAKQWNMSLSFNNSNSTNQLKAATLPAFTQDSLVLVQTNASASFNTSYQIMSNTEKQSTLNLVCSYQKANTIENDMVLKDQLSTYVFGSLSHIFSDNANGCTLTSTILFNYGLLPGNMVFTAAPGFTINKKLLNNKGSLTGALTYSHIRTNRLLKNSVLNIRLSGNYRLGEKQQINCQFGWVTNWGNSNRNMREININLGYSLSF